VSEVLDRPIRADAQALAAWIAGEIAPRADELDAAQQIPPALFTAIAKSGLLGACVPLSYGGAQYDARSILTVCEALGRASASVLSLFTVHTMVSSAIARWGNAAQRALWLPSLAGGETIGALALSEPEAGSDTGGVRATLRRDGESLVLSGVKTWISFGQVASVFLVSAILDGRVAAVLVERHDPGVHVTPVSGMAGFRAGMLARIEFDECRTPATSLLGNPAFGLSQIVGSVLDHGRFCIAGGSAGLARACTDVAIRHARSRLTFGQPLAEHPLVQRLLTDLMVDSRAAWLMCLDAAASRDARRPDMLVRTSAAKYFAAQAADKCAASALQLHGASGLAAGHPVQRYLHDAKVMNLIEGSTQIQQMLIAQSGMQWLQEWGI
jgi:glutaryl-CoA dehydrogenase (non-decarboxylating)